MGRLGVTIDERVRGQFAFFRGSKVGALVRLSANSLVEILDLERLEFDMYKVSVATVAEQSGDFRRVLWTGKHVQLVVMTIPPGGEIGDETHHSTDQILTFVSGSGEADIAGKTLAGGPGRPGRRCRPAP